MKHCFIKTIVLFFSLVIFGSNSNASEQKLTCDVVYQYSNTTKREIVEVEKEGEGYAIDVFFFRKEHIRKKGDWLVFDRMKGNRKRGERQFIRLNEKTGKIIATLEYYQGYNDGGTNRFEGDCF